MPRKAKETEELKEEKKVAKKATKSTSTTTKKQSSTTTKKSTAKKTASSKTTTAKKSTSTTSKKATSTKKVATSSSKKTTTKKSTTKKTTASSKKKVNIQVVPTEYYDLPHKYNETVVKVLAQTPKTLFIYWEISDEDMNKYKEQYGENFFETTKPILIIHNDTLNYSFEVEINDFANSWYLHINDSKSDYRVELGRRPIENNKNLETNYIHITSSNGIESPNDHILFNNSQKMIYFRNVKTEAIIEKPTANLYFMKNMGKIYNIYDLYKELYKNEDDLENLSNPSSHTSSQFK